MLRIKLVRSLIGHNARNRRTIQALGLRKINQVVEHNDTPSIRGMIQHVKFALVVEVPEGTAPINDATVKSQSSRPMSANIHKKLGAASKQGGSK